MDFDLEKIPNYKKAISYLRPVWLNNKTSDVNPHLELLLYKGRFQLATRDALYSDGEYYTPGLAVIKCLKPFLPQVKSMLILGVGLGSTVQIMEKAGFFPRFTLVELDKVILKLAVEFLSKSTKAVLEPICEDAEVFMAGNKTRHDLIFIDIFDSRTVPDFVTTQDFLTHCKHSLNPGGRVALNYIINDEDKWKETLKTFSKVFPDSEILEADINRIFISAAHQTHQ
ncbi:MAG: hypothetical protein H7257_05900 [Taibaiella sp.]|nr:hypothetical protein [Taibaiella sp.]